MKCAACGNDAGGDVKYCRVCGKYLSGNAPESDAGEAAAEFAGIAGERLCLCCQTPLEPGHSFCCNCGFPADGRGGNPYAGNAERGGAGDSGNSAAVLSLMKEMKIITGCIIGCASVPALLFLIELMGIFLTLKISMMTSSNILVFIFGSRMLFAVGGLILYGYILLKTPSLARRCGELCREDRYIAERIDKVRSRVKFLWIFLVLFLMYCAAFIYVLILWWDQFLKMFMGHSTDGETELLLLGTGSYVLSFAVLVILDLIFKALMLIDFIKVKSTIERMTVRGR